MGIEVKKVAVWGTGNVGRPAIRAVDSHANLELSGVIVADPRKVGLDAGDIAGVDLCGVIATDDWRAVLDAEPDAVVYAASADLRPEEAIGDLMECLKRGINVVSSAFYTLLYPEIPDDDLADAINQICQKSRASLFVSGIDPGWMMDMLPIVLTGASSAIREIRSREIFNYALYDQPEVVRDVVGFGTSMNKIPPMLHEDGLKIVWGPMVRLVGDVLGQPVDRVETFVERRPLERNIEIQDMGTFEKGSQGAFRFEVRGMVNGEARYVVEHVTRIDDECATDWPFPPAGGGCHQVLISGNPDITVTMHGKDHFDSGAAAGGNASAAAWLVNAITSVCEGRPGILTIRDLPPVSGAAQLD